MLTVGIVNHDLAEFLPRAIESALLNTDKVIVVDDASTDDSLAVCSRYPVEVIEHEVNSGSAVKGWNELIDACTTDWLIFLSADDELMPWTHEMVGGADWVWGDLEVIDEASRPIELYHYMNFPRTLDECVTYIERNLSLYPTMIAAFRTAWLKDKRAVEFPNTKGFADTATGLTWLRAGPKLKYVPRTFARYRRRASSETFTADRETMRQDLTEMLGGNK